MFIVMPIVAAVVLVFFGYIALWSASQPNTPAGVSSFGRVLAIIIFVVAGLAIVAGVSRGCMGGKMMPGMPGMPGCKGQMMQEMMERGQGGMHQGFEGRGMMQGGDRDQKGQEKPAQK